MLLSGTACLISSIAACALDGVRAARKISFGLCLASCKIVSLPRPALPGRCQFSSLMNMRKSTDRL